MSLHLQPLATPRARRRAACAVAHAVCSHFGVSGCIGLRDRCVLGARRAASARRCCRAPARRAAARVFAPISAAHWLGTDYLGRDMLARVIEGARYTVGVALRRDAAGQRHRHRARAAGRRERPLDRRGAEPRPGHADRDPEQDVRAADGGGLRLLGADAGRHRRDHLRAGRLPHRALAGRQHQRARLRDRRAHARRRHAAT